MPLLEDYPQLWLSIFKSKLLKEKPSDMSILVYQEFNQCFYEAFYQQQTSCYEFYLLLKLLYSFTPLNKYTRILHLIFIIYISLYTRRFNIFFVVTSWLLPVFFYYFFVLTDYLEVLEELLAYIRERSS